MTGHPGRRSTIVGRTEELAALDDAFDAAADGLVVVLVGADPGMGKTTLARAFAADLRRRGVPVHWGSCAETGGAPALWPWIQAVRSLGDDAVEVAQQGLASRADEPFAAYDTLSEVLHLRANERRVLVFDDLHRADLPSLELLRLLATSAHDLPLLVVGTHRIHELRADPGREAILTAVAGVGRRVTLDALGSADVTALLADRGVDDVAGDVAAEVLARSGGNALYVEQLVDAVERGGREALAQVPDGIRAAVRARLAPLAPGTRALLSRAAILGPGFRPEVLAVVAAVPVEEVQRDLAAAVDAGVLAPDGGELVFTHVLIRDTLDEELDLVTRAHTHAAAAVALAGSRVHPVPPAVIAQHLIDAGDRVVPAEVARWADEAADEARGVGAHHEVARWAEEAALHWGRAGDTERQGAALVAAIESWVSMGDGSAALARSAELADLARRSGSGRLLGAAALARAEVFEPAQDLDAPPLLLEALAHPEVQDDSRLVADLHWGVASLLGMPSVDGPRRDVVEARRSLAALEALAADGDPHASARLQAARLDVESGPEHFEARKGWFAESARLLPPGPSLLDRLHRAYWATSLAFEAGDLREVDRQLREWERLADRSRSSYWRWRAAMARASHSYATGQLGLAERQVLDQSALVAGLHPEMAARVAGGLLVTIRRDQRRLSELAGLGPGLDLVGILVAIEAGDLAAARRQLPAVMAAAEASGPDDLYWLCLMSLAATAADEVGDEACCRSVADQLEPFVGQSVMWGRSFVFGMPVAEGLGRARRGAGQHAEAAEAFRSAMAWADGAGAPGFGARARAGLASVLRPGSDERAALVAETRAVASRLGMALVVSQVDALAAEDTALGGGSVDALPAPGTPMRAAARRPAPTGTGSAPGPRSGGSPGPDLRVAPPSAAPPTARVRTLGRFEVLGAGAVEPARWSSRKARDALKVLICRRGRSIPREELIELLWPDVDLASGRNRLSVVLSMLRSVLDPERQLPSDPLRSDRQAVALDLDLVEVDVEVFLAAATRAVAAADQHDPVAGSLLATALASGDGGPFLAEDPYADFASPLRHAVDRARRDVLRGLARHAARSGDQGGEVSWLTRLVELDPDDEAAFASLTGLLEARGHLGEVNALRSARAERLGSLGLDPAP